MAIRTVPSAMSNHPDESLDLAAALTTAVRALGDGSRTALFDLFADDVRWSWMGVESWSRTFEGKQAVLDELFGGVDATLSDQQGVEVLAVTAGGERVVVEFNGFNTTPDGHRYDNRYCWVVTFRSGLISEVREYMDTKLVSDVFGLT